MRFRRALVLLTVHCSLFTVLQGCASLPLRMPAVGPQPLPPQLAAYYDYPPRTSAAEVQLVREHRGLRECLVHFPFSVTDFQPTEPVVEFEWFESNEPGRRPGILVNPILGGDYPLERGICRFFARQGFHVALIHRKTLKISPEHDVTHLELLLRQGILRIRQVVDWMASREEVDASRLGSFGISMGGIAGIISAAVEPRLRCHVVALAGGGIPEIVLGSPDVLLRKPRERYLAAHHLDLTTMEALLRQHIVTDPIRLAPYVDARRVLMVIALADRTVGTTNALRLWRALGRPEVVFLPAGHYTTYLYLPLLKFASVRFFQRQLEVRNP